MGTDLCQLYKLTRVITLYSKLTPVEISVLLSPCHFIQIPEEEFRLYTEARWTVSMCLWRYWCFYDNINFVVLISGNHLFTNKEVMLPNGQCCAVNKPLKNLRIKARHSKHLKVAAKSIITFFFIVFLRVILFSLRVFFEDLKQVSYIYC